MAASQVPFLAELRKQLKNYIAQEATLPQLFSNVTSSSFNTWSNESNALQLHAAIRFKDDVAILILEFNWT